MKEMSNTNPSYYASKLLHKLFPINSQKKHQLNKNQSN